MKKSCLLIIVSILLYTNIFSQQFNTSKLDSLFDRLESYDKFMGGIAISKHGEEVYAKSIGFADIENNKKTDSTSTYRIGSITKMFTAILTFFAIEEGKLNLEDTLDNFFPDIENAETITIAHLLGHRSGIFNFTDYGDYMAWSSKPKTRKELLKRIQKKPNLFQPDETTKYSNSNYVLLTFILEAIFKKTYSELVNDKIIGPLGLQTTYSPIDNNQTNNECNSYRFFMGGWNKMTRTHPSVPLGAGNIISTPTELNQFIIALFSKKLISEKSLTQMTSITDGLGLGIFKFPFQEKTVFGHTGGIDGFSSFLGYLSNEAISISLTSNGTAFNNNDIMIMSLKAVFGIDFELPNFDAIELDVTLLKSYLGEYESEQLPFVISVTEKDNGLLVQATGQSAFEPHAVDKNIFRFDAAGIELVFHPEKDQMTLKQGGASFLFTRKKE